MRAAPRWWKSVHAFERPTAPAKRPSPTVHGCAPTRQPRPPTSSRRLRVRTRERATASSLERGDAARALAAHARCAALAGVCPRPMKPHCASETALSLGQRPCSGVAAVASNKQQAFACAHTRTRHRVLSRVRWHSTRGCGACALGRADWSRFMPYASSLRQRDGPLTRSTAVL